MLFYPKNMPEMWFVTAKNDNRIVLGPYASEAAASERIARAFGGRSMYVAIKAINETDNKYTTGEAAYDDLGRIVTLTERRKGDRRKG